MSDPAAIRRALEIVTGDRQRDYGDPVECHARAAGLVHLMTGLDLTPRDVAMVLVAVKLARLRHDPGHEDSIVDAIGYLGIAGMCAQARDDAHSKKEN
jgi:hypothetical protein